jgi:hypothetical protein
MILLPNYGRIWFSPGQKTLMYSVGGAVNRDQAPLIPKDFSN